MISIVIPIYNESDIISLLRQRLVNFLDELECLVEVIFVDDGSLDDTAHQIKEWIKTDNRIILIELTRNFGHQPAITAGLEESKGDAVIIMDADLQDPPEIIHQMIEEWHKGYQIVLAERKSRNESFIRRAVFQMFYKCFAFFTDLDNVMSGVFGLMDRVVVNQMLRMQERNRFIPGLRSWVGFKTINIWYDRQPRQLGSPKQTITKLFKYGCDAIFSFSYKPLRISFIFGLIVSSFCFLYALVLIVLRILEVNLVLGFTTTSVAIFFVGGVILISNGIIGEYLGRIYDEVKQRPLFIISRRTSNMDGNVQVTREEKQHV